MVSVSYLNVNKVKPIRPCRVWRASVSTGYASQAHQQASVSVGVEWKHSQTEYTTSCDLVSPRAPAQITAERFC